MFPSNSVFMENKDKKQQTEIERKHATKSKSGWLRSHRRRKEKKIPKQEENSVDEIEPNLAAPLSAGPSPRHGCSIPRSTNSTESLKPPLSPFRFSSFSLQICNGSLFPFQLEEIRQKRAAERLHKVSSGSDLESANPYGVLRSPSSFSFPNRSLPSLFLESCCFAFAFCRHAEIRRRRPIDSRGYSSFWSFTWYLTMPSYSISFVQVLHCILLHLLLIDASRGLYNFSPNFPWFSGFWAYIHNDLSVRWVLVFVFCFFFMLRLCLI